MQTEQKPLEPRALSEQGAAKYIGISRLFLAQPRMACKRALAPCTNARQTRAEAKTN